MNKYRIVGSGVASPNERVQLRSTSNGGLLGETVAGADGKWSLTIDWPTHVPGVNVVSASTGDTIPYQTLSYQSPGHLPATQHSKSTSKLRKIFGVS